LGVQDTTGDKHGQICRSSTNVRPLPIVISVLIGCWQPRVFARLLHRRMKSLFSSSVILALALATIWAGTAFADRRVALVIGNSAYQNAPTLLNPTKDADAIAAMLQKAGFDVVNAQHDLGTLQFNQAIQRFETQATDSDVAVVYYAGYGINVRDINYLIPIDAKLASIAATKTEAISLNHLANSVKAAKQLRLVILEVCGSTSFPQVVPPGTVGLATVEPDTDTLIAYGAKAYTEGEDCHAKESPYNVALLRTLFIPGLDIRFAFGRVLQRVLTATGKRQRPWVYGHIRRSGRISLVPPSPNQPAIDLVGEQVDYSVVETIAAETPWVAVRTWEAFLVQHPTGFYADAARQKLSAAEVSAPSVAVQERQAKLEEAKQKEEYDRREAEWEAALERARLEARAAEEKRERAEREADLKRKEAEKEKELAAAARSKQEKARREAALKRAEEEAKAAEEARLTAEREARVKHSRVVQERRARPREPAPHATQRGSPGGSHSGGVTIGVGF